LLAIFLKSIDISYNASVCDTIKTILKDPLQVLIGPNTWSKENKLKNVFNRLIQSIWVKVNWNEAILSTSDNKTLVNLIYVQEGPNLSTS